MAEEKECLCPVCETEVKEAEGEVAEYKKKKFIFCSVDCKQAFEESPEEYYIKHGGPA